MMIDYIDEIDCCVKSDIADGCAKDVYGYTTIERMGELIARLRQAEKDAERYRWLKEIGRHDYDVDDFFDGSSDSIDERIDAAMIEE